jgi:hypothetical protein
MGGRIGTHAEMLVFNIDKKLVELNPDRDEARPLAQAKAFEGAMLLAAALTLTRKNSILLPDRPVDPAASPRRSNQRSCCGIGMLVTFTHYLTDPCSMKQPTGACGSITARSENI